MIPTFRCRASDRTVMFTPEPSMTGPMGKIPVTRAPAQ